MSARVRAANPRRKRRRWPHALWVLPVLCAIPVGVRVRSYDVPVFAFAPEAGAPRALAGAMHLHSLRSDGRSTPEEIAEQASHAGLDFVVLTDHNLAPEPPRSSSGVLVLSGTEVTTRDGHLLALDYQGEPPTAGTPAHEAVARIRQLGGFTAVAHGHDPKAPWQRWDLPRIQGLEIYNAASDARRHLRFPFLSLLGAALAFPLKPDVALILLHGRSHRDLATLDSIGRNRHVFALCGLDAHGIPSYERLFRAMRTYVPSSPAVGSAAAARGIWDALRGGRSYCAVELFGDASRFTFHAERSGERFEMGATVPLGAPVFFRARLGVAPAPSAPAPVAELVLFRDGDEVARSGDGTLAFAATERGVYRVEVTLPIPGFFGGSHRETWIYTNPIFVRRTPLSAPGTATPALPPPALPPPAAAQPAPGMQPSTH